ncbi:OLC1v1016377C1 [Oldenlandia corymbosa var. corymbosa]|uniref:OLC1v1016377C1 n=1 Tax=Oldenlandia corymbosa var. corymbosa TaxID=529605 RepID=A0AAV1E6T4_OLDCO|nr:OLC1v1016377C1 [Oldenlandia corymbosa var. corymbosa]
MAAALVEESNKQPLLSNLEEEDNCHLLQDSIQQVIHQPNRNTNNLLFDADEGEINPINGAGDFFREFVNESNKLWYLAAPAIFTSFSQYSIGAMTQVFAGHLGALELAAVAVARSAVSGFAFGIMVIKKTKKKV